MIKHLHSAYQGHFKEWLVAKGYNKNLNDLVKMLDKWSAFIYDALETINLIYVKNFSLSNCLEDNINYN